MRTNTMRKFFTGNLQLASGYGPVLLGGTPSNLDFLCLGNLEIMTVPGFVLVDIPHARTNDF